MRSLGVLGLLFCTTTLATAGCPDVRPVITAEVQEVCYPPTYTICVDLSVVSGTKCAETFAGTPGNDIFYGRGGSDLFLRSGGADMVYCRGPASCLVHGSQLKTYVYCQDTRAWVRVRKGKLRRVC